MKKYLTLSNVIKVVALVFGLTAFFLMFGNQLYLEVLGKKSYMDFNEAMFGKYGSVITFIGYLLILIGTLGSVGLVFAPLDGKIKKYINLGIAIVMITGSIFVFVEAAVVNGRYQWESLYSLAACPIIAGIFGIVAALAVAVSDFVPNKQLLK